MLSPDILRQLRREAKRLRQDRYRKSSKDDAVNCVRDLDKIEKAIKLLESVGKVKEK